MAGNSFHVDLTGEIHVIHNYEFADVTALNATGSYVSSDIGKAARTISDGNFWILSSVTSGTPTWSSLGTGGSVTSGTLIASGQLLQNLIVLNSTAISTLSGNLFASGQALQLSDTLLRTADTTLSGIILANQILDTTATSTLSGNLFNSGQILLVGEQLLNTTIGTLSGNLFASGQTLQFYDSLLRSADGALSGIVLANQSLDIAAIATLSGNLFTSGQLLLLGEQLLNIADAALSGNLFTSGQILSRLASGSIDGLMRGSDKTKLDGIGGARIIKAGFVSGSVFAGNPKKTTITFVTAFSNTSYAITISPAASRSMSYESKTISGFVMNANANGAFTEEVSWMAINNGETTE